MSVPPEDGVIEMLREIRATLDGHSDKLGLLDTIGHSVAELHEERRRVERLEEAQRTAGGLA